MSEAWTRDTVSKRMREAWDTLRRIPAAGIPGFKTAWPEVVLDYFEAYGQCAPAVRLSPASPVAIDKMHETFTWFVHLDGRKHLTAAAWLMCGRQLGSRRAGEVLGVHRNTANDWRNEALDLIVEGLNKAAVANVRNVRECAEVPR